eukprot:577898-Pyramimonas_sp.AAC.1
MLPPRWPQKCIRRIDTPPAQLQGRGLGVYFRFRGMAFYAMTLYYPPKPSDRRSMPNYLSCCEKLTRWASNAVGKAPHSAIPFIMTDVNDGMGLSKQTGQWENVGEQAIGLGVTHERHVWGAGHRLRELMEEHGMFSTTSYQKVAATFYDAHGNT